MSSSLRKSSGKEPAAKKSLFEDSSASSSEDDQDDGGATLDSSAAGLKINAEYARRFEHNKKREELHRLHEKYKGEAEDDDGSSSGAETEDDEGFLLTEDLDAEISATLKAIKNKDPRIYDKDAVFYKPFDPEKDLPKKEKKEDPLYLKDYHRQRYLAGDVGADEDGDAAKPRTYAQEQADLKKSIVSEINAAAAEDEEWSDDDAFLKPVKKDDDVKPTENGDHRLKPAFELTEVDVANADKNPDEFLEKFMASRAWAMPEGSNWEAFESDDGDDDNIDMADEVEHAYNIRFEDPAKSNEILKGYSRNMAASKSVRREELTGRKRLRALEKEKREAEKAQREEERARLRRLKVDEAAEKLEKIKQAAGLSGKSLEEDDLVKLLAEDWEDEKWEEEMKKRFNDDYYAVKEDLLGEGEDEEEEEEGGEEDHEGEAKQKKKKPKKPEWDDDIDINDIIPDFENDDDKVSLTDGEQDLVAGADEVEADYDSESNDDRPSKKRKTSKDVKKDKIAAKRQAREDLAKIEALVDTKMEIDNPRILASSSKKSAGGFRYRETSPTSFGLTPRDILLAPSDAALNEFAGLKKLATFRDAEKKRRDKKKLGKKARLRQWRREQFGHEYEQTGPTYGFEKLAEEGETSKAGGSSRSKASRPDKKSKKRTAVEGSADGEENTQAAVDGVIDGERKKKRKRSKGKKKAEVEG